MSRFDEYAKSLSRRDLLKRAGVVGGAAVVSTTLIQSVAAPAYAASGCSDPSLNCGGATCAAAQCPPGAMCRADADCAVGYCLGGRCAAAAQTGARCQGTTQLEKDKSCQTSYCDSSNTCATPPVNQANGEPCHAGTAVNAGNQCAPGNICVDESHYPCNCGYEAGVCRLMNNQVCTMDDECATKNCVASAVPGVKTCQSR